MQTNRRWLSYDTFKLIVAMILVILLLILPRTVGQPAAPAVTGGALPPDIPQELRAGLPAGYELHQADDGRWLITGANAAALYYWDAGLKQWNAFTSAAVVTPTAPPAPAPSQTPIPTEMAALAPTPAPTTVPPTATPVPTQAPTAAPEVAATAQTQAPTAQVSAPAQDCSVAAPARLEVGKSARVTSNLNLRSAPAIGDNLMRVSLVGTTLKVTGGPQCVPYAGGAYRWWQVQAPDGAQGWSAEATLNGGMYFLEPLP